MSQRRIDTGKPSDARNAHSAGVVVSGTFLFTSGITPRDDDGAVVGTGDMAAQVRQVFANLSDVLAAAECGYEDVVKYTVFVTDLDAYRAARGVLAAEFAEIMVAAPASTLVEISRLAAPALMVEVEAIAVLKERGA
ncbi:MAG: RidA family protein [Rhodospirillaceae bacterium]